MSKTRNILDFVINKTVADVPKPFNQLFFSNLLHLIVSALMIKATTSKEQ